jgi:hypothetical protein
VAGADASVPHHPGLHRRAVVPAGALKQTGGVAAAAGRQGCMPHDAVAWRFEGI